MHRRLPAFSSAGRVCGATPPRQGKIGYAFPNAARGAAAIRFATLPHCSRRSALAVLRRPNAAAVPVLKFPLSLSCIASSFVAHRYNRVRLFAAKPVVAPSASKKTTHTRKGIFGHHHLDRTQRWRPDPASSENKSQDQPSGPSDEEDAERELPIRIGRPQQQSAPAILRNEDRMQLQDVPRTNAEEMQDRTRELNVQSDQGKPLVWAGQGAVNTTIAPPHQRQPTTAGIRNEGRTQLQDVLRTKDEEARDRTRELNVQSDQGRPIVWRGQSAVNTVVGAQDALPHPRQFAKADARNEDCMQLQDVPRTNAEEMQDRTRELNVQSDQGKPLVWPGQPAANTPIDAQHVQQVRPDTQEPRAKGVGAFRRLASPIRRASARVSAKYVEPAVRLPPDRHRTYRARSQTEEQQQHRSTRDQQDLPTPQ